MTLHLRPVPRRYSFALEQARARVLADLTSTKLEKLHDAKLPRRHAERQAYLQNGGVEVSELPKRLQNSLNRIKGCGGVALVHHTSEGSTDFQLANGRGVSETVISKLREAGVLASGKDGLFGGDEQTLHVVSA